MGSRANVVVIRHGRRRVYFNQWVAQDMDRYVFWGPQHLLDIMEDEDWDNAAEGDPDEVDLWLDDIWAEGGCCIDFDRRHVLLYGGEDIECDVLWIETYLRLLGYTWPGWSAEWSWGKLAQIAEYAGVTGARLDEIGRSTTYMPPEQHLDRYVESSLRLLDLDYRPCGASTLSATVDGMSRVAFTSEEWPTAWLYIGDYVEKALHRLADGPLRYEGDLFIMGGVHIDYDAREILIWRVYDNNIRIELTGYWDGWRLRDFGPDYRGYYRAVPHVIDFKPKTDYYYVGRALNWVAGSRGDAGEDPEACDLKDSIRLCRSMPAMGRQWLPEDASELLMAALEGYLRDNPHPHQLPAL